MAGGLPEPPIVPELVWLATVGVVAGAAAGKRNVPLVTHPNSGKTVDEILGEKRGSIKQAPLPARFPGWDRVGNMTWEDVVNHASNNRAGFKELKKLLGDKRFNK